MSIDKSMNRTVSLVVLQMENSSYFGASKHKLSAFFSLIFRFSSCHHPLLASALSKIIMQDQGNRAVVGKDENAVRQLISMISSDNRDVVCWIYFPFLSEIKHVVFSFLSDFYTVFIVVTCVWSNKPALLYQLLLEMFLWPCS